VEVRAKKYHRNFAAKSEFEPFTPFVDYFYQNNLGENCVTKNTKLIL